MRIHTEARSTTASRSLGARAFTVGSEIFFGEGAFRPDTAPGRETVAHELIHVVQGAGTPVPTSGPVAVSDPSAPAELEARASGRSIAAGAVDAARPVAAATAVVHRQPVEQGTEIPMRGGVPVFPPEIIAEPTARNQIKALKEERDVLTLLDGIEDLVWSGGHKEATFEERLWLLQTLQSEPQVWHYVRAAPGSARPDRRNDESGVLTQALWESFGDDLLPVAADNVDLFKRSVARLGGPGRLAAVKGVQEAFERDVKATGLDYLAKNSRLVMNEMERIGLAGGAVATSGPVSDVVPEQVQVLGAMQEAAAKAMQAQELLDQMRELPVGYRFVMAEGYEAKLVETFDPQHQPEVPLPTGSIWVNNRYPTREILFVKGFDQGDPPGYADEVPVPGYEGVKKAHEALRVELAKFMSDYPAVYAAKQAGRLGELAKGSPQEARAVIGATLHEVIGNIQKTYPKLEGGGDFWFKLKPIHDQLFAGTVAGPSGTPWSQPLYAFIGKEMVKAYEDAEFWKDLGLSVLAAAAFLVAELATAGGATFFIAAGVGAGITGYQMYKSWDEAFALASAEKSEVGEELQLVYPEQARAAFIGAIIQTVFGILDIGGPALHWAKAARAGLVPELAAKGVAAADVIGIEGLAAREAVKEITPKEAGQIVERAVTEYGVEGAARRAGLDPHELLRYVDRDSEVGRRITEYTKAKPPAGPTEAPEPGSVAPPSGTAHVPTPTDAYPEGLVHYGLTQAQARRSYLASIFEDKAREAGVWMDLQTGEYITVQGGPDFVTSGWMAEAEFGGRRWRLVEHFHPRFGESRGYEIISRYASDKDFAAMMHPHWGQVPPLEPTESVSTLIRWQEGGRPRFTTIGYDPGVDQPFWIEYRDTAGVTQRLRFSDYPTNRGSDYRRWLDERYREAGFGGVDWSASGGTASLPPVRTSGAAGTAATAVGAAALGELGAKLRTLAKLEPAEAEAVLSRAIEELGPAEALRQVDMDWKTLAGTLPKPSGAGRKLLHWRDSILGEEIRKLLPEEEALRTGTKGSFENDFDWNFLGTNAVENRAKVVSFLSGRTGMTPDQMPKLLAADFFTDPRRMLMYEQLPAGIRDRVARRQADLERQLIWNGELTEAISRGDQALQARIRGQMQRLGVPEARGGVKLMSPEDIRVAEAEIDKLHQEFEQAMGRKDFATAEQRAIDISDRQAQINAASGGAYVSYGAVRKFAVEREPELAILLEGEMLQPGWYTAVLDQMPHMRHALEELETAVTKGDMAAAMRAIGKYGDRMTSLANVGLAKSGVGVAASEELEWEFKLLYARSKMAAGDAASLQAKLAKDLEGTMAHVSQLLDELEQVSEEVLTSLQKTADIDVLFEEVQLYTHLHVKFLKAKQATYWQLTTMLKALRAGTLPETWAEPSNE